MSSNIFEYELEYVRFLFFSATSDPASAGRVVPGPIPITVGGQAGGKQLAFNCNQTAGVAAIYSFLIKYANLF